MSTEPSPLPLSNHARLDFEERCSSQVTPISLVHFTGYCMVQIVVLGRRKDDIDLYPCGDVVAHGQRFRFSPAYVAMLLEQGIPYVEAIETAAFVARALAEVQTIAEIGDRSITAGVSIAEPGSSRWIATLRYTCTGREIPLGRNETPEPNVDFAQSALTRRIEKHIARYPGARVERKPACSASST